jgi:hypothetical protein
MEDSIAAVGLWRGTFGNPEGLHKPSGDRRDHLTNAFTSLHAL